MGAALAEIRSNRLYRATHERWEDYCLDKWGLTLSRCNQLIQTTRTYDNLIAALPQDAALLSEANEHTLRPLNSLDPQLQTATWELIRRIEERPVGTTIQTVVERIKEAISDGWQERNATDVDSQASDPGESNGSTARNETTTRSRRIAERKSDQLATFCRWTNTVANWDVEVLALCDDRLCLERHLRSARKLKTFCELFIAALEGRIANQARA